MGMPVRDLQQWRLIATIETHACLADVHRLIARDLPDVRLERVIGAPSKCGWFNVLIDAGEGEGQYARTASALLRSMHRATDAGRIVEFRLVDGNQWLMQRHGGAAAPKKF
ncbi:MAG TPA: hypothetical protein VLK83_08865 [Rhodanobacteraceae bacterium]|jgi:hypothetical protein|nr:hypothetical protein [Rhodanobacteraceae bacterium]